VQETTNGEFTVSGFLHEGKLFFPSKGDKQKPVTVEPTAIYEGELSSPEDVRRDDKEVKATLESLSHRLKEQLGQESVFISYRDEHWCV